MKNKSKKSYMIKDDDSKINSPSHYTYGGIETIDIIEAKSTEEQSIGFLRGNAIKYVTRAGQKGSTVKDTIDDYKKAIWNLSRIVAVMEKGIKKNGRKRG